MSISSNESDKMSHTVNNLSDYLTIERVDAHVAIGSKKKLLEHIANLLGEEDKALTKKIFHSIVEREKLGSTGVGNGIAIPHGRCADIEVAKLCIVTLKEAVDYDASDGESINIAFGLIVPTEANQQHLSLLSTIAELMSNKDTHQQLLSSQTAAEIFKHVN